jgi:ketosteroid isomerase-like protein
MLFLSLRAAALLVLVCFSSQANDQTAGATKTVSQASLPPAARAAAAVVDAFHAALARGDTKGALALLADDALIFESGGVERGKAEYAAHHLAADAAFSQAVPATRTRRTGSAIGSIAWVASEGRTTGTYGGKPVDRITSETMVLRRAGANWKIVHIHWSSAASKKE